ncbi:rho GTPase-activating protein 32 isoform X1 [Astyanax mexicanus]|uniref:Rho GTPase-activating protein 32 n=1 Tax=Astyanax mexicanus TaxID=7994 RepID=A0A8T2L2V5_ASTMX|nr:rho GTPase-activating protein 32 isoform X1 [Astyanax mexicanus]
MEAGSETAAAPHSTAPAPLGDAASHDPLQGVCLPSPHPLEVERRPQSVERAGWEDAIALMARSADVVSELPAESSLRSCTSTASMKVKNVKKLTLSKGHFPRLEECAHFHYENVDFGSVQLSLAKDQNDLMRSSPDSKELVYLIQICCQGRKWIVRRSYEDFRVLDKHLHLCIYDRRFSLLSELPRFDSLTDKSEPLSQMLTAYLSRLSAIADNKINCGPALTWMEIDNKGNHLLVHDESSINVPAVAAAHVIKRYIAQAADELSFEVGDIVSVIDMPPKEDTGWWRGKHGFQVGFFPYECVELISEKVPPHVTSSLPKPVSKKHGKLITFLRTFVKSRPTKQKLKQRGILRERVFGCDLGEHLLNSGHDVPQVIKSCAEFIEKHGVVDGIYRLSGIASNIQKLRHEFDSEHIPDLTKDTYIQDIHSVGSLCKLYFRELPNPLLTYQLYDKFSDAVSAATDDERLVKIHDVIQQLPPPHYRTLEFLMRHLARMATFSYVTNMHCKNLAIVWAPNLLRSKQIESACFSGTSAFMEVRIQSVVVEFILNHVDVLFSPKLSTLIRESTGHSTLSRPKSLLVCSPSTKLLSLEEAQARTQAQLVSPVSPDSKYIEVGEGPAALQGRFHTVIEFPMERKKVQTKVKKSPVASWRSFFNMGKSSTTAKRKLHRHPSEPNEIKTMALPGGRGDSGTLRSAKSEESLSSHNLEGGSGAYRPRRPRSTSDALSTSFNEELLNNRAHRDFSSSHKDSRKDPAVSTSCVPALISPPHSADADLGMAFPDFDPMSFQSCAPPAETTVSDGRKRGSRRRNGGSSSESEPLNKVTSPVLSSEAKPKATDDASHRHSTSGKFAPAVKAKVELESSESVPEGLIQNNELDLETKGLPVPPTEVTSPLSKPGESIRVDECQQKPLSLSQTKGEASEKAHNEQTQPGKQEESGAVMFDCTPGLVRSVSLITPQPSVKSAARMLALALAESAQQATRLRKRGSSEPPTPVSPVHLQDPLSLLQWPPPSSLQPQTSSTTREDRCNNCKAFAAPASTISTGSRTDAGSMQSTFACHGSESGLSYSDGGDVSSTSHGTNVLAQDLPAGKSVDLNQASESHASMRENVRHVGVGTDGGGPGQSSEMESFNSPKPSQLLSQAESSLHCTTESHTATAALLSKQIANASNFRAILAEASMPASVHEVLPHAPITPPSSGYHYSPKEDNMQRSLGHMYSHHWSSPLRQNTSYIQPDYVQHQAISKDHYNTLAPRSLHQSIKYKGQPRDEYSPSRLYRHGGPRYPPMDGASVYPTIRRVRSMHAPPEDKFYFFQHPSCQNNPYQIPVPSDIHHVRPYFEDGKVQYRYSPYSEARYNNMDQYSRVNSQGYSHSYTLRRPPPHSGRVMSSIENYPNPCLNPQPFSREGSFIKQDLGQIPRGKNSSLYKVFDSGLPDHFEHFAQTNRQIGNPGKKRLPDPAGAHPRHQKGSQRCHETMHTRSKSDSGKDLLISTEGADGKYRVTMVSHYSPEHPLSEPDISLPGQLERQGSGPGAKASLRLKQSRSMYNYPQHVLEAQPLPRNLTLHKEYSCPDFKHPDSSDGGSIRYQDKQIYKTLRSYPKEDYQYVWVKSHDLQRPERSQSVKSRQPPGRAKMAPERDHRPLYPVQSRARTRSMYVPSRTDYMDGYMSVQPKVPKPSRMGTAVFPNYGCMPLHSNRLYSSAVGQGGFLHSELRPETEIYAE